MVLCEMDRKLIMKRAYFLVKKEFIFNYDDYSIVYSNGKIVFTIYYERYSDNAGINITFNKSFGKNITFNVGWIAVVSNSLKFKKESRLEKINYLLDYIENHYEDITDLKFCKDNAAKIDDYVNNSLNKEIDMLHTKVDFLIEKGYSIDINQYGITAMNNTVVFKMSKVYIEVKFLYQNERFDVIQIAQYISHINLYGETDLDTMLNSICYIRNNYEDLTNIDYCRECRKNIEKIKLEEKENIDKNLRR